MPYGFSQHVWDAAKHEITEVLVERAKVRGAIPYSELVGRVHAINFSAHDPRLFHALGEISTSEAQAGRGMLSALVVHKEGDMQPGPGFFELAKSLGRNTSDVLRFWVEEFKKVHTYWGKA